jgi:hypothetical protein
MPLRIVWRFFVDIVCGSGLFIGIGGVAVGLHWLVNYLEYLNTSAYITVVLGIVAYITFTLDVLAYLFYFVFSILLVNGTGKLGHTAAPESASQRSVCDGGEWVSALARALPR